MAQELNDDQLSKLTTKRLLALLKSVRKKGDLPSEYFNDGIDYKLYMERIKRRLNTRGHVER